MDRKLIPWMLLSAGVALVGGIGLAVASAHQGGYFVVLLAGLSLFLQMLRWAI